MTLGDGDYGQPYPPLGFCAFREHELGNGDEFGLYWPIGREDFEPIVAETHHDEWSVKPFFSTLGRFLVAAGDEDDDSLIESPDLSVDPDSPTACLSAAREAIKAGNVESAIQLLGRAVVFVPEYTDAQAVLSSQYRRIGKLDAAIKTAIQAIISPPCFGNCPKQLVQWLGRQAAGPPEVEADPIWKNRMRLTFQFGGAKENDDYVVLRDAIDHYLGEAAFIPAMTLMQTYCQLMYAETVSFRERYRFNVEEFVEWQRSVAETQYGKSRTIQNNLGAEDDQ